MGRLFQPLFFYLFLLGTTACQHPADSPVDEPGPSQPRPSWPSVRLHQSGGMMGMDDRVSVHGNWELSVTGRHRNFRRALGRGEQARLKQILGAFHTLDFQKDQRAYDGLQVDLQANGWGSNRGGEPDANALLSFLRRAMADNGAESPIQDQGQAPGPPPMIGLPPLDPTSPSFFR